MSIKEQVDTLITFRGKCYNIKYTYPCEECIFNNTSICRALNSELRLSILIKIKENDYDIQATLFDINL